MDAANLFAEVIATVFIVAALILGGGPQGLGDNILHFLAVPVMVLAFVRMSRMALGRWEKTIISLWLVSILLIGVQLIPLPVSWMRGLPMREQVLRDLAVVGQQPSTMPWTLAWWSTVRALLAVVTTFSIFLLTMTLPKASLRRILIAICVAGVVMALFGFAQAAAGSHSNLRPYAFHHPIGAIGAFANRNHFGDFMAMLLPLTIAFGSEAFVKGNHSRVLLWFAGFVIILLAAALSFSRTGIILAFIATLAGFWIVPKKRLGKLGLLIPLCALAMGFIGIYIYAYSGIAARLNQDPLSDLRFQYLEYGEAVVTAYWPVGSGFGSFPWVYAPFEPINAMTNSFAARAHNDALQVSIAAGAFGVVLILLWLVALVALALRNFRPAEQSATNTIFIARVVSIAMMVPLLHSVVDYPLRTLAVASTAAVFMAVALRYRPAATVIAPSFGVAPVRA